MKETGPGFDGVDTRGDSERAGSSQTELAEEKKVTDEEMSDTKTAKGQPETPESESKQNDDNPASAQHDPSTNTNQETTNRQPDTNNQPNSTPEQEQDNTQHEKVEDAQAADDHGGGELVEGLEDDIMY